MTATEKLSPSDFLVGLMVGDRRTQHSGYSPENAALAVAEARSLNAHDYTALLVYAHGVCDGMQQRMGHVDHVDYELPLTASALLARSYVEGRTRGFDQDPAQVLPTPAP